MPCIVPHDPVSYTLGIGLGLGLCSPRAREQNLAQTVVVVVVVVRDPHIMSHDVLRKTQAL